MLLKAEEDPFFYAQLHHFIATQIMPQTETEITPFEYQTTLKNVQLKSAPKMKTKMPIFEAPIFYPEQLFGTIRQPEHAPLQIEFGLLQKANSGVLLLSLDQLLDFPDCLKRLQQALLLRAFKWLAPDPAQPLPLNIPDLPLDLKVILIGDRFALSELQMMQPSFFNACFYGEFEAIYHRDPKPWLDYIQFLTFSIQNRYFNLDAFPLLLKEAMRFCEDQTRLPLNPSWLLNLLQYLPEQQDEITATQLKTALTQREWQLNYLPEQLYSAILEKQVTIYTEGEQIGQINGLSVVEYPGYPQEIGEPSRISCAIGLGEGEIIDVERKTELGGNLHSKGVMIMQSLLDKEFLKNRPLPFDFTLVFEQSYNEVDGDSASLAGFCALLSALSNLPIDQQLAITGSIDQNGNVQAIGGINHKIEGFFEICKQRGLTGKQGVIIPAINQTQLCLNDAVLDAIKNEQFSIFTVMHFSQAIELLMHLPYHNETPFNLKSVIHARLNQFNAQDQTRSKSRFWRFFK